MRDAKSLKSDLEAAQAKHVKEAEHIAKLLSAITEAEQYLGSTGKDETQQKLPSAAKTNRRRSTKKTGRERIREALGKMPDSFTSKDLWNAANEDEQGKKIEASTFRPFMSKLIRESTILTIQKPLGTTPGTYKRNPNA